MDWFYASKNERKGPINESELNALISSGEISSSTLVWNKSMPDWKTAGEMKLGKSIVSTPGTTPAPGQHTCVITGKNFPASQMIETDHGWVSAEGKDIYYQALREGGPIPLAAGQTNAIAQGKYIIVPATDVRLPQRCVKTNQPVTEDDVKRKALYWCTPTIYFAILINVLVVIVLNYVFRKKVMIDIPLSKQGQSMVRKNMIIMWALVLVGITLFVVGFLFADTQSGGAYVMLIPVGLLAMLFGIAFGNRKACALRVAKIKDGQAWLAGAGREYLASLPSS
jgi:hypothetical protein